MAKVKFKMPDALQQKFERLQKGSGELIDKCVQAGADVFENAIRNNLRTVLSGDHQNGELVNSLGVTPVLTDREGVHNAKIGFNEPRQHQTKAKGKRSYNVQTNAMIATVLEYGSSRVKARPFLKPAKRSSQKQALAAIERTYNEEVAKV